ncbi:MFS transporter [Qipengyuania algicida]|nr:MFS transporter [Qipengyuania algicida]
MESERPGSGSDSLSMVEARQSWAFLGAYALAWAGGSIAYVPFLTILLPSRIAELHDQTDAVWWLSTLAFSGAIMASIANILAGLASDLTRSRRPWVLAGLAVNLFALLQFGRAETPAQFILLIVIWQLSLNMVLAPLAAWAGDCVPDGQKGVLGGLLALAPALGALSSVFVTMAAAGQLGVQLALVAGLVAVFILPVLIFVAPRKVPIDTAPTPVAERRKAIVIPRATAIMWLARFLVQLAESSLFAFLLLFFRSVSEDVSETSVASLFAVVLCMAVPIALLVGRWSDRHGRPILPLAVCAAVSGFGLIAMALSRDLAMVSANYIVFGTATAVFLSLHAAQTLRVLPRSDRRGRDLGFFNLTNTVPSIVMPIFALTLIPALGFPAMMVMLAVLSFIASFLLVLLAKRAASRQQV